MEARCKKNFGIQMSELDDDLPLDALVKKHHSENNNGNNENLKNNEIIPLTDPDGGEESKSQSDSESDTGTGVFTFQKVLFL